MRAPVEINSLSVCWTVSSLVQDDRFSYSCLDRGWIISHHEVLDELSQQLIYWYLESGTLSTYECDLVSLSTVNSSVFVVRSSDCLSLVHDLFCSPFGLNRNTIYKLTSVNFILLLWKNNKSCFYLYILKLFRKNKKLIIDKRKMILSDINCDSL